jgi:hypothetical protein
VVVVLALVVVRAHHRGPQTVRIWSRVALVKSIRSARQLPIVLEDDQGTLFSTPPRRAAFFRTLRSLGVGIVRISSDWSEQAPDGSAGRPPAGFDARDPNAYPLSRMANLDMAVRAAAAAGITADVDIGFYAPRWATRSSPEPDLAGANPYHRYVNPTMFAAYAGMLARRYDGSFTPRGETRPLPRVNVFELWNEPNLGWDFEPQRVGGRAVSPDLYRRMVQLAYPAIKAINPAATVLIGNTSSVGGIAPIPFVEQLACVDRFLRPIRTGACAGFKQLPAGGFAHHPYEYTRPPWEASAGPGEVPIAELSRLQWLLDRLVALHRLAPGAAHLWLTEAGYQSSDQLPGISPWNEAQQAQFLAISEYEAWADPRAATFAQFQLRDSRVAATLRGREASGNHRLLLTGTWTTGLERQGGAHKAAFAMLRAPVVGRVLGSGAGCHAIEVWGRLQPDQARVQHVTVQFALAPGGYQSVRRVWTGSDGVLDAVLRFAGAMPARVRLIFGSPGGSVLSPAAIPATLGTQPLPAGVPARIACR